MTSRMSEGFVEWPESVKELLRQAWDSHYRKNSFWQGLEIGRTKKPSKKSRKQLKRWIKEMQRATQQA